jgi:hypothetical protein
MVAGMPESQRTILESPDPFNPIQHVLVRIYF